MNRALAAGPILALLLVPPQAWAGEPHGDEARDEGAAHDGHPCPGHHGAHGCPHHGAGEAAAGVDAVFEDDEQGAHDDDEEADRAHPYPCPHEAGSDAGCCPNGAGDGPHDDDEGGWRDGGWEPGEGVRIVPSAQYRLRFRHEEGRDFRAGDPVRNYFRHRVRAGLQTTWQDKLGVYLEVQDVRTYGEETSTVDGAANAIDLHQGYAILKPTKGLEIRLGRQEIGLENERLVGKSAWGEEGRVFDALRLSFDKDELHAEMFYARLRELAPAGAAAEAVADLGARAHFAAFDVRHRLFTELVPAILGTVDLDDQSGKRHVTIGALVEGEIEKVATYGLEGYFQTGRTTPELSHSAFMFGLRARGTFPVPSRPYLETAASFSSGDADLDDLVDRTFASPQGTPHKFYGDVDIFTNLPRDTGNRGLREVTVAIGCAPVEGMSLRSSFHLFQSMADRNDALVTFGEELDNRFEYRFWKHAAVDLGYAFFVPQQLKRLGVADPVVEHFVYSTVDLSF
ncbi:MAG: alginate export family protein [Myxococcales bacterium]|nr:alginate export family protein [Myxococcales bacterium]